MAKRLTLVTLLTMLSFAVWSNPIDPILAQRMAAQFYQRVYHTMPNADLGIQLACTRHSDEKNGATAYYVFNVGTGFVIVAGDDRVPPVLGHSDRNAFDAEHLPDNMQLLLDEYARSIDFITRQETEQNKLWNKYLQSKDTIDGIIIAPLLTTHWGQGAYYNDLCPADADGINGHAVTGCQATAMAQVINYWEYPVTGSGTYSYNCNYSEVGTGYGDYGTLYVNFGATTYDYANMPDVLDSTSTPEQVEAVATLMYHCGVSVNTIYGTAGSAAPSIFAVNALKNYFRYPSNVEMCFHSSYNSTEWAKLIRRELDNGAPVIYSGNDPDHGGHAFVCDGYSDDDFFHINWGWRGNCDGYFKLELLDPNIYSFNTSQSAFINVNPRLVGIESKQIVSNIYPNPTNNLLNIRTINNLQNVQLTDLSGRIILQKDCNGPEATLHLSEFPEGVYFLHLSTEAGDAVQKIIKY